MTGGNLDNVIKRIINRLSVHLLNRKPLCAS